jgi:hypothetical protein
LKAIKRLATIILYGNTNTFAPCMIVLKKRIRKNREADAKKMQE